MPDEPETPQSGDDESLTSTEIALVRSALLDEVAGLLDRLESGAHEKAGTPDPEGDDLRRAIAASLALAEARAYRTARMRILAELKPGDTNPKH